MITITYRTGRQAEQRIKLSKKKMGFTFVDELAQIEVEQYDIPLVVARDDKGEYQNYYPTLFADGLAIPMSHVVKIEREGLEISFEECSFTL